MFLQNMNFQRPTYRLLWIRVKEQHVKRQGKSNDQQNSEKDYPQKGQNDGLKHEDIHSRETPFLQVCYEHNPGQEHRHNERLQTSGCSTHHCRLGGAEQ